MTSKVLNNVISSRSKGDIAKLFWTCLLCPSIFLAEVFFFCCSALLCQHRVLGCCFWFVWCGFFVVVVVCVGFFVCVLFFPPSFALHFFFWYCIVGVGFDLFTCVLQISHKLAMQSS